MAKYLDDNGLLYLWSKIKTLVGTKEDKITKNTAFNKNFETSADNIKANGTASAGTSTNIARADHIHPTDETRLAKSGDASNTTSRIIKDATARTNIESGSTLATNFSRIWVWFNDMKTVAFTGAYSDLTGKPTNVSSFTNDAEYVDFTQMKDYLPEALPEYGFQTESDVEEIVEGYGYQTAANVESIVTGKGYQTAAQVQSAINSAVSTVYRYKGSKATYAELPASGNTTGDVWNVTATGMNYVWTGSAWDALGSELNIEVISNSDIDTIVAS